MEWFVAGFVAMIACVLAANYIDQKKAELDAKSSEPDPIEDAARAVYAARTEDEHEAAVEALLEVSNRSLDDRG